QPVVTGFTAGIAVSIFSNQIKDLLGLRMGAVPADFVERLRAYGHHIGDCTPASVAIAVACLAAILALRRWAPRWPGFLIAVAGAATAGALLALPVETIASKFGGIPAALPRFDFPDIPFERTRELFPSAFTIAFLAGVESLLSAVVADG